MLASTRLQIPSTYKHVWTSLSLISRSAQQYHEQGCGISQIHHGDVFIAKYIFPHWGSGGSFKLGHSPFGGILDVFDNILT